MNKNSLISATPQGLVKATKALQRHYGTQLNLANNLRGLVSRSTIQKLFQAKAIQIDKFKEIYKALKLDWEEIAVPYDEEADIDVLVQEVREKVKEYIQECCGTTRVLDMAQPVDLDDIYTHVNILEESTRYKNPGSLPNYDPNEFDHFPGGKVTGNRISGLKAVKNHSKLMVLGKPGAGKTTFLKYLAIQCIKGEFQENRVPFFIPLKQFAEARNQPEIHEFIVQQLNDDSIINTQIIQLLNSGKFLLLLDGLDEVKEEDSSKVINQIKEFTERYCKNQFVITCRIAAQEYIFEKFTEVEVADFDEQQIKKFVTNWFQSKEPDAPGRFIQQLKSNNRIKELATNPLLLTLLCLEFEDSGDFPSDRVELYHRAIHTLLRKWDSKRGIVRDVRDEIYKNLSVGHKEDLLSEVAWTTFERSEYFFKQRDIERYIQDYIRNLPEAKTDPEALRIDSELVLKSIEAHHGLLVERARCIYSFSHLTFHEYFTSRHIAFSSKQENTLNILASKISEKRWREVFLLTVGLLNRADRLLELMKQQIDELLVGDTKLQHLLTRVKQKSESVEAVYKPAAIRAFYLDLFRTLPLSRVLDLSLSRVLDLSLSRTLYLSSDQALDLSLDRVLSRVLSLSQTFSLSFDSSDSSVSSVSQTLDLDHNSELKRSLQELKDQLPDRHEVDKEALKPWLQKNGQAWAEKLRTVMIEHRNIGHDWQFNESQKKLLWQYYNANKLLVDCLNSSRCVSLEMRQKIEDTLLLPKVETWVYDEIRPK